MIRGKDKYRLMVENLPDAFAYHQMIFDCEGRPVDYIFLDVNPAFETMTGLLRENVIGKKVTEVHPSIKDLDFDWINTYGRVAVSGENIRFEQYFELEDRWYEISAYSDEPGYFAVVFRNITSSKKIYETLWESETRFLDLFEKSPIGIIFVDTKGNILQINPRAFEIYGSPSKEETTERINVFQYPPLVKVAQVMKECIEKNKLVTHEEFYTSSWGKSAYLRYRMNPKYNFKGEITGVIATVEDITERKRAEERFNLLLEEQEILLNNIDTQVWYLKDIETYGIVNNARADFYCVDKSELEQKALWAISSSEDEVMTCIAGNRQVFEEKRPIKTEEWVVNGKGELRLLAITKTPKFNADGVVEYVVCSAIDMTERKQAEENLKVAHQHLEQIIEFFPDATFMIDQQSRVAFWNKAMEELMGLSKSQILGKGNYEYALPFYEERRPMLIDLVLLPESEQAILRQKYGGFRQEDNLLVGENFIPEAYGGKGAYLWGFATKIFDINGKAIGAIESIRDITEHKQTEEKLKYISLHDQLTGLYNRVFFEEEMQRLGKSRDYPITIISVDLDDLKIINDALGHHQGDEILKVCADVLQKSLRGSDILARIGGDEFTVILFRASENRGREIAHRIKANIDLYNKQHPELPLSISIGIATANNSSVTIEDTLKKADDLMYREKAQHKTGSSKIIDAFMVALAERDYITEGHALRLSAYSSAIGNRLGLSSKQLADLALLSGVHDLGKVGLPDSILFKDGPLNDAEWEIMRQHPEKGRRIAMASPSLAGIADLILKHHERWDGEGYPIGLKGADIPIECRVLAIVDAYDVMISDRPYSKAKSQEEAIEELIRCSGTQFDSEIVGVFLLVLDPEGF